jgi:hypothetical protein
MDSRSEAMSRVIQSLCGQYGVLHRPRTSYTHGNGLPSITASMARPVVSLYPARRVNRFVHALASAGVWAEVPVPLSVDDGDAEGESLK